MIISVVGIDGCGKTTQAKKIVEHYEHMGKHVKLLKLVDNGIGRIDVFRKTSAYIKRQKDIITKEQKEGIIAAYTFLGIVNEKLISIKQEYDVIVLDRYVETQYLLYILCGINSIYTNEILGAVPPLDYNFWLDVSPAICLKRIDDRNIKKDKSILEQQKNMLYASEYYRSNAERFKFIRIDGNDKTQNVSLQILSYLETKKQ